MNLLTWKRPKSESTILAEHRILESRDGCYKVVRSRIMVGRQCGYPDAWYAIQTVPRERILGRHRTKEAAMRTCEQHESKIGGGNNGSMAQRVAKGHRSSVLGGSARSATDCPA